MKIRTVKRGRITIYELWSDNRTKQTAASTKFLDYINLCGDGAVEASPQLLKRLCKYRFRKLEEEKYERH